MAWQGSVVGFRRVVDFGSNGLGIGRSLDMVVKAIPIVKNAHAARWPNYENSTGTSRHDVRLAVRLLLSDKRSSFMQ